MSHFLCCKRDRWQTSATLSYNALQILLCHRGFGTRCCFDTCLMSVYDWLASPYAFNYTRNKKDPSRFLVMKSALAFWKSRKSPTESKYERQNKSLNVHLGLIFFIWNRKKGSNYSSTTTVTQAKQLEPWLNVGNFMGIEAWGSFS